MGPETIAFFKLLSLKSDTTVHTYTQWQCSTRVYLTRIFPNLLNKGMVLKRDRYHTVQTDTIHIHSVSVPELAEPVYDTPQVMDR